MNTCWFDLTEHCTLASFMRLWQEGKILTDELSILHPSSEYYPAAIRTIRALIRSFYGELSKSRAPVQTDPAYYGHVIATAFSEDIFGGEDPEEFAYLHQSDAFGEIIRRLGEKWGRKVEFMEMCPVAEDGDDFPITQESAK